MTFRTNLLPNFIAVANPEVILNRLSRDFIAIGGEIVLRIQFGVHFYGLREVVAFFFLLGRRNSIPVR